MKKQKMCTLVALLLIISLLAGNLDPFLARAEGENAGDPTVTGTEVPEEPSETPSPTPSPSPTPTDIPIITAPPGEPVLPEEDATADAFRNGTYENSTAYTLIGYDNGAVISEKDSNLPVYASELSEWLFMLYVLSRTELPTGVEANIRTLISEEAAVTVSKKALENAGKVAYPVLAGLKEGDKIAYKDLVIMYLMTGADDAREVLVAYLAGTDRRAVYEMNRIARAYGLNKTHAETTDGAYSAKQYTTVSDLYKLFLTLMKYPTFAENIELASCQVSVNRSGAEVQTICPNRMFGDILLYGDIEVPEGFTFRARFSGGCQAGLGAQVMFVTGANGFNYVTVVANIPFEKDLAIESRRFLELKGEYFDEDQELPLGDDTVRYKYLLDAEVQYYTMDNRPYSYMTKQMTDRYMMSLTVPVWKLNEKTGARTEGKMTIPIHRKLYRSLKEIMQEVFELPLQFPIKTFLGYGYRQSGGVGLSLCTLISVHSYGAAVDINPGDYDNDYFLGKGNDLRNKDNPYCIPDEVIAIFEAHGWNWGGNFNICSDTMHFQYLGLDYLSYQGRDPFVRLAPAENMNVGVEVKNLQERLAELGYNAPQNGIYNNRTRTALMKFQSDHGLPANGEVDYKTWETIINLTHYMSYVF
ncbi:MAG: M15 family metallopeptidase [Lachnospiraceae bacterium]|nr:M15 family metallopeptidase [Lachnospiraceae bacterium]